MSKKLRKRRTPLYPKGKLRVFKEPWSPKTRKPESTEAYMATPIPQDVVNSGVVSNNTHFLHIVGVGPNKEAMARSGWFNAMPSVRTLAEIEKETEPISDEELKAITLWRKKESIQTRQTKLIKKLMEYRIHTEY